MKFYVSKSCLKLRRTKSKIQKRQVHTVIVFFKLKNSTTPTEK